MKAGIAFTQQNLNDHPEMQAQILAELECLFTCAPPDRLRDTLIVIYQIYVMKEEENGFPLNFQVMAGHVFQLLESIRRIELTLCGEGELME